MTRSAYLKKDRQEHRKARTVVMKTAWRLVTDEGIDVVLPWFDTKGEARDFAKSNGIVILGDYPPAIPRTGG